jgi:hypothetical protein
MHTHAFAVTIAAVPWLTLAYPCIFACLLQGPREDSGFHSGVDTGIRLASQLYSYIKKYHPKTQLMASGLRTADGEPAAAGIVRGLAALERRS